MTFKIEVTEKNKTRNKHNTHNYLQNFIFFLIKIFKNSKIKKRNIHRSNSGNIKNTKMFFLIQKNKFVSTTNCWKQISYSINFPKETHKSVFSSVLYLSFITLIKLMNFIFKFSASVLFLIHLHRTHAKAKAVNSYSLSRHFEYL